MLHTINITHVQIYLESNVAMAELNETRAVMVDTQRSLEAGATIAELDKTRAAMTTNLKKLRNFDEPQVTMTANLKKPGN